MLGHTRKHHIKQSNYINKTEANNLEENIYINAKDYLREKNGNLPRWAVVFRGYRAREGLTQKELGEKLEISQANISKMEKGKRPIGKKLANKLADFFHTDYRIFL